jgi:hypothetical protein
MRASTGRPPGEKTVARQARPHRERFERLRRTGRCGEGPGWPRGHSGLRHAHVRRHLGAGFACGRSRHIVPRPDQHPGPWRFLSPDPHVATPRAGSPAGAACNRVLLPDPSRPLRRRDSGRRIPGVREQRDLRSNGRKAASSRRLALRPTRNQVERRRRVRFPVARVTRVCPGAEAGRRGDLPREDRRNAGSPTDLDVFGHSSSVASPSLRGRPRPEMENPEPSTEAGRHPVLHRFMLATRRDWQISSQSCAAVPIEGFANDTATHQG